MPSPYLLYIINDETADMKLFFSIAAIAFENSSFPFLLPLYSQMFSNNSFRPELDALQHSTIKARTGWGGVSTPVPCR